MYMYKMYMHTDIDFNACSSRTCTSGFHTAGGKGDIPPSLNAF